METKFISPPSPENNLTTSLENFKQVKVDSVEHLKEYFDTIKISKETRTIFVEDKECQELIIDSIVERFHDKTIWKGYTFVITMENLRRIEFRNNKNFENKIIVKENLYPIEFENYPLKSIIYPNQNYQTPIVNQNKQIEATTIFAIIILILLILILINLQI